VTCGRSKQLRLQRTRQLPCGRVATKQRPAAMSATRRGLPSTAPCPGANSTTRAAALGLIKVGGTQHYGQPLLGDQRAHDFPQLTSRQRIDADRRLQQASKSGDRTSVQARPSFCFMPPTTARQARAKRSQALSSRSATDSAARARCTHAMQVGYRSRFSATVRSSYRPKRLRHVADAVLDLLRIARDIDPEHAQRAAVGPQQPAARRISVVLPAPSGPTSAVKLAMAGFERYPGKRPRSASPLR